MTVNTKKPLNNSVAERAKPREVITDTKSPGFKLKVSPAGRKVWAAHFRLEGKVYTKSFGVFPKLEWKEAKGQFEEFYQSVANGEVKKEKPEEKKPETKGLTVGELANDFLQAKIDKGRKEKTIKDYRRHLDFIKAYLGEDRLVVTVSARDCEDMHREYPSPVQANRMMDTFRNAFNRALNLEMVDKRNVAKSVERNIEIVRGVNAGPEDVLRLFEYAKANEPPEWRLFFYTLMVSGARVEQVKRMMWTEVRDGCWYKTGDVSKNRKDTRVYLGDDHINLLKTLDNKVVIFGSYAHRKPWERVREACNLGFLRMHDLRKIWGSYLLDSGHDMKTISLWLQHTDQKVTEKNYAHSSTDSKTVVEAIQTIAPLSLCQ